MVHLRAVSYDDFMDDTTPGAAIRDSVDALVAAVRDSSCQLANATETFALESLHAMDAVRSRSEQAAETSAEMARAAKAALEEARGLAAGMRTTSEEAQQSLEERSQKIDEQISAQETRLNEQSTAIGSQFHERIKEAIARLDTRMEEHRETFERGLTAIAAAEAVANRVEDSVAEVAEAARSAQTAAQQAQQATQQSETYLGSALTAVAAARELAGTVTPSSNQTTDVNPGALATDELLGRLEDDYSRLTLLVQQLHTRIGALAGPNDGAPAEVASAPVATSDPTADLPEPAPSPDQAAPTSEATPGQPEQASQIADRIQVNFSPVQNFDRLLALDDALNAVSAVTSVTLGDYQHDQVTFRVEFGEKITADTLVDQLTAATGLVFELADQTEASLTIRIS